jgi:hypothetical protein
MDLGSAGDLTSAADLLSPADLLPAIDLLPAVDLLPSADLLPKPECQWGGAPGSCMSTSSCGAIADHTAESSSDCKSGSYCCIDTPNVADNPATPAGWVLMKQAQVTADMTTWAVMILHDPVTYPMWSTTMRTFGTQQVLARVEWHPPDFQNGAIHRGVTLYVPR